MTPRGPPPPERHGSILAELAFLLGLHIRRATPGCRIVVRPGVAPELWGDRALRAPALAVTFAPPSAAHAIPEPVVIIDIMPHGSADGVLADVFAYQSIPSVAEIILFSSDSVAAQAWRRAADGAWPEQPEAAGRGDRLEIARIGFARRLADVYASTDLLA